MLILYTHKKVLFNEFKDLLDITPGNLDHHLKKLEEVDYIRIKKRIFPSRPLNEISITNVGISAFKEYCSKFKSILRELDLE